jgi:23S rRNA (guanosine2251-2'-O)-methyltransferase
MARKITNEELPRLSPESFAAAEKHPVAVVLDNIRSLHNVGSVFRTCDAFLIRKLVLCGVTGTPPDREIEKTALGATATVAWEKHASTALAIRSLRAEGYEIYAVEQVEGSIMLDRFRRGDRPIALVFGNEVYGVEQEVVDLCDGAIEIPQAGTKHSLNVSVSAGIVLWEIFGGT